MSILASIRRRVFVYRWQWKARRRRHRPGRLSKNAVIGIALHWPAMSKPIRGRANVEAALRNWQSFHMDVRGWSDVAYQEAIDQDGIVYTLRGIRNRSAANGSSSLNGRYGAFLLVLGPGEEPSAAMIDATRRRIKAHRKWFPASTEIVGHGDIRPGGTELSLIHI